MTTRKKSSKKTPLKDSITEYHSEEFSHEDIAENMTRNMIQYARQSFTRAIPDVRDGLIEVRRRIIYSMYHDAHLSSTSKHMKVAKTAGLALGYHPHGDSSISEATTTMSQPWNLNAPLVDIEGNKGSTLDREFADGRYIEGRLTVYSESMLGGIKDDAVRMIPNFDNTAVEPEVLPASFPQLLVNGNPRPKMAVGYSSMIAPHNIVEITKAAELVNRKPEATLSEIMRMVPGPFLPTGNIVMGRDGIKDIYSTGVGSFVIRARSHQEDGSIVITEVPFGVTRNELIDSIVKCVTDNNIEHLVKDIYDESSGGEDDSSDEDVRIVVELEKNAPADMVLKFLHKKSNLQINFSARHIALVNGMPTTVNLKEYLQHFVDFRTETIRRMLEEEQRIKKERQHIVEGFIRMIDIADDVIAEIRRSQGRADAAAAIEKKFGFTDRQSLAIVSLQLYRISAQDLRQLKEELSQLNDRLDVIGTILGSDEELRKEVSKDLKATIKKFSKEKRADGDTEIVDKVETINVDAGSMVPTQETMVVVKPYGVQRMSQTVWDNNHDKYPGIVIGDYSTDTKHGIALFTRGGKVIQRRVSDIDNSSIKNEPEDIRRTTSTFESGDEIIGAVTFPMDNAEDTGLSVITVTHQGQVKVSQLSKSFLAFTQKGYMTRTKPYCGMKIKDDYAIACVVVPTEKVKDVNFSLKRHSGGRVTKVDMSTINEQGATGGGVSKLKMTKEGDYATITRHNFDSVATMVYIA